MPKTHKVPLLITEAAAKNPYRTPRYKISLVKDGGSIHTTGRPIKEAKQLLPLAQELFGDADRELFFVVCLDNKLKIIGVNLVSTGTLTATLTHPREVFKAAVLLNASTVIVLHNHPSGNPEPSPQDHALTDRLILAGVVIGISLSDHLIYADDGYYSFEEYGNMGYSLEQAKRKLGY